MCDYSDTEPYADTENEDPGPAKQKRRLHKLQPTTFHNRNFDNLALECLEDYEKQSSRIKSPASVMKTVTQNPTLTPSNATISTGQPNVSEFPYPITPERGENSTAQPATQQSPFPNTIEIGFLSPRDEVLNKSQEVVMNDETYNYLLHTTPHQEQLGTTTDKINETLTQILENQKLILQNQQLLSENQNHILLKTVELSTQFDELIKKCVTSETKEVNFKLITSAEEAETLEMKLKDATYKAELVKKFSVVCGREKGKGADNAYIFVDLIFCREFMNQCSWTGGSKTEEPKICFRAYIRIFDFFFDLVRMSDKHFTKKECTMFFKSVLRNSVSRSNCKQIRASTSRNRPKGTKQKIQALSDLPKQTKVNAANISDQDPHKITQDNNSSDDSDLL
ncbi:uncharacterized protein LOC134664197 [Cydia fagiglandana]|uniref:uncharacterized protein LOC134658422 n=1 Tax=Cydia amplana TaxID=1869771 RepID=UPI002FE613E4